MMNTFQEYPGTPHHRSLLRAIASHYASDPRILAVIVFGSLGRGNWDPYSDLDLDIIIADDMHLDVVHELELMFDSLVGMDEQIALLIPYGVDAADIVLASLMELSVRYHPLASASPNIVESMRILWGRIDEATIRAAGLANRQAQDRSSNRLLDMCVRYAVGADVALQRRQLWGAVEIEHRIRGLLMELFAHTHDNLRPVNAFQKEADAALQALLGSTLPRYDLPSAQRALINFLDILEHYLAQFSGERVQLTEAQRNVLGRVRQRQSNLNLE